MANTYVDYTASASQTDFAFSFPYLEDTHVVVEIDGIDKTITTDFTIPSNGLVRLNSGATAGQLVRVKRVSDFATDLVNFVNGSVLNEADLDKAYQHNRYLNEEAAEGNNASMQLVGGGTDFNAANNKIVNLADPTADNDAVNKSYIDTRIALSGTSLNGFDKSTHTGDNTETQFTLSFTAQVASPEAYLVTIDGVVQTPTTAYSVDTSNNKITFTSAPPTSANIVVVPIGTSSSANDAAVTQAGTSTTKTLANWTNDLQSATATGSTTSRSLADRFADVVNVKDFGATGDGSDQTDEIQAAINYAASISEFDRPVVYIPSGEYGVVSLDWATNVSIKGDSRRSTVLNSLGAAGQHVINRPSGASFGGSSQYIRDIYFKKTTNALSADAINLTGGAVNGICIENCWFNGFDNGIRMGRDDSLNGYIGDVWITDCVVELSQRGIRIEGNTPTGRSDDLNVSNFLAFKCQEFGLDLQNVITSNVDNCRIAHCGFESSGFAGIRLSSCERIDFSNINIQQPNSAPELSGRRLVSISSCLNISFNGGQWVGADGTSTSTDFGVYLSGVCDDVSFTGITVKGTDGDAPDSPITGYGWQIGDGTNATTNIQLMGCSALDVGAAGIKFNNNASGSIIGCMVDNPWKNDTTTSTRPGIDIRTTGKVIVMGCQVQGTNITAGHGIHASSDSNKKIIGCYANEGITATGVSRVFISDCDDNGTGNVSQFTTATISPGTVTAGNTYSTNVTLTGARLGDAVLVGEGTTTADGLIVTCRVDSADTITLLLYNPNTATDVVVSSSDWKFKLQKIQP